MECSLDEMERIAKTSSLRKILNLSVCGSDFVSAFGRWRVGGCWMYGRGSCFLDVKLINLRKLKLATSENRKSDEIPLENMG